MATSNGRQPTVIDLFCGAGGLSLGFQNAGFQILAGFDSSQVNVDTYGLNFPSARAVKCDLGNLTGKQLLATIGARVGEVDVIIAGPPCQGFSLIGKRAPSDTRNGLLGHVLEFVGTIRPRYFVVENVQGLLSGATKPLADDFVRRADTLGYDVVTPVKVLDAKDFGVPQTRKRVFFLGSRRAAKPPVYPRPGVLTNDLEKGTPTVIDAIGDFPDIQGIAALYLTDRFRGVLGKPSRYSARLRKDAPNRQSAPTTGGTGIGGLALTRHTKETVARFALTPPGCTEVVSRFPRLDPFGVAPTLRAGTGPEHGSHTAARPIHPSQPRVITTREAARLQSFPDWFEFHPSKWHGFRQVGNSVPPILAESVGAALIANLM